MPFQKGNKLAAGIKSGGRKGYEYEKEQLERMRGLVNGLLDLAEKIKKGKATDKQIERFNTLLKLNLKILDKLHANRQYTEVETTQPITIQVMRFEDGDNNSA